MDRASNRGSPPVAPASRGLAGSGGGGADEKLGVGAATALVVGYTIAVGIFLTPAEVIGLVASPALTLGLWVVCGLLVLAGAFTFGELASRYPEAGGPYVFLREAWGDRAAFLFGWQALLVMDPGVVAALATGLSQYMVVAWPAAEGSERWIAVAFIWILAAVGMSGLKPSVGVLGALTGLKVVVVLLVAVLAFAIGDGSWSNLTPFVGSRSGAPPLGQALAAGLMGVFFSFGGFWEASRVAGEVRDEARTVPVALVLGVTAVIVVYLTTTLAFMYLVPVESTTSATQFAERAGVAMFGRHGPTFLASVVVLSVAASLVALFIMAPRVYMAMQRDGVVPRALVPGGTATSTPVRAMALLALLASLLVFIGSFEEIVAFFMCTTLVFVALAAAALPVARRRDPRAGGFRSPGYPLTPALFVLLLAAVVLLVAINRPVQAFTGFGIVLLGIPAHALVQLRRRRGDGPEGGGDPTSLPPG